MTKRNVKKTSIITSCTESSRCQCSDCIKCSSQTSQTSCSSQTSSQTSCSSHTTCPTQTSSQTTCPTQTSCSSQTTQTSCPTSSQTCTTSQTSCSSQSSSQTSSQSTCPTQTSCTSSSDSITDTEGSVCESSSSSEEILGNRKFNITFGSKCGHLYEKDICGDKAIYVNCKQGPILKLKRGFVYYFNVKQKCDDYSFVLTKNPVGKIGCVAAEPLCDSFDPITHGCAKYHVTSKTPKYFYYQSSNDAFMGGLILVEDC